MKTFFPKLEGPVRLGEAGITKERFEEIFSLMKKNEASGRAHTPDDNDRKEILELMY